MQKDSYEEQFIEAKRRYFEIGNVHCAALENEVIHFSRHGFEHLIRKNGKMRSVSEQIRRFHLLKYAAIAVKKGTLREYRVLDKKKVSVHFWSLFYEAHGKIIKVVITRYDKGEKQFLSIMDL